MTEVGRENSGWIDIHAHILPGIDDGAKNWEETREMLNMSYEQGIRCVIATPHYFRGQDLSVLEQAYERLKEEASAVSQDFSVELGQEIMYFEELPEYLEARKILTLAGSRYVLVEFGPGVSFCSLYRAVRRLVQASYLPVIAHVERYRCLREARNTEELIRCGAYLQMNVRSLTGGIFDREAGWCRKEIRKGNIHFLATDMHGRKKRPPDMEEALSWVLRRCGEQTQRQIFKLNQRCVLEDRIL